MADYENDRLLSEKRIIEAAYQRFGLGAIKIKELLRDIPSASALTVNIPGEDRRKADNGGTHTTRLENQAETTA